MKQAHDSIVLLAVFAAIMVVVAWGQHYSAAWKLVLVAGLVVLTVAAWATSELRSSGVASPRIRPTSPGEPPPHH